MSARTLCIRCAFVRLQIWVCVSGRFRTRLPATPHCFPSLVVPALPPSCLLLRVVSVCGRFRPQLPATFPCSPPVVAGPPRCVRSVVGCRPACSLLPLRIIRSATDRAGRMRGQHSARNRLFCLSECRFRRDGSDEESGDLHRIEGRSLADLVGDAPEGEPVG